MVRDGAELVVPWWLGLNEKGKECYKLLSAEIPSVGSGVYMAPTGTYLATLLPPDSEMYCRVPPARGIWLIVQITRHTQSTHR